MTYAPTTHAGHHISGDRILLIVLALLAAAAVVAVATGTWTLPTIGGETETPAETSAASYDTRVHAADVAEAGRELQALRNVVTSNPTMAAALAEDITTLDLVVTGQLPVEAVQTAVAATPVVLDGRTEAMIGARADLAAMHELVREAPVLRSAYHEEMATLDAVVHGFVPVETIR
jgi:hypothetical protein